MATRRSNVLVRAMAEETGPEAFLRQQQAIIGRPDSRPGLAAIACPTLVLVGDSDALTPPALAQEIAGGIRGARLVVIAGMRALIDGGAARGGDAGAGRVDGVMMQSVETISEKKL